MSKSRGNVVEPWDVIDQPRRRCLPLVLLRLAAAVGGLPLLRRHRRGRGPPLPAHPLEHLRVLGHLRERRRPRDRRAALRAEVDRGRFRGGHRARPLGCLPPAAHDRRGPRADGRLRLHPRGPRDRRLHRGALQLVRAAQPPPLLGRGPRGARDPALLPRRDRQDARSLHALHRRRDLRQPALRRGDRPREAGRRVDQPGAGLGPPLRLPRRPGGPDRPAARGGDGRGPPHRRARPGGPRPGQGEAPPAAPQGRGGRLRRRARGDRAPRRGGRLRAQRQGARLRPDGGRARLLPGEAELPLARAALRQEHAAGGRRGRGPRRHGGRATRSSVGEEVGISVDGKDHTL